VQKAGSDARGSVYTLRFAHTHFADVDECTTGTACAGPNTACNNTVGSYTCDCLPGFSPVGTDTKVNGCQGEGDVNGDVRADCNDV
jgi:hypothetical protein